MAKYNCDTFGQYANLLKQDIKAAMRGKIRNPADVEEYECGFVEVDAPKDECEKIILKSFDEIVDQALKAMVFTRALERLLEENGVEYTKETQSRYTALCMEVLFELFDYDYEYECVED